MAGTKQFRLPDVGEGLTEAEIVSWKVQPGDTVQVNDVIVEIETAKSLVELPCPFAGTVTELLADEGATVDVGSPIISVDTTGGSGTADTAATDAAAAGAPAPAGDQAVESGLIGGSAPGGRTSVLVGYGPRTTEAKRRPRRTSAAATPSTPQGAVAQEAVQTAMEPVAGPTPVPPVQEAPETIAAGVPAPSDDPAGQAAGVFAAPGADVRVLAKPPVRKLARDLGVDLAALTPSGPNGVITRADVEEAAADAAATGTAAGPPGARETRVPVKGVRRVTAQAMVASAFTAPHVTEWLTVDVTRTMELVERLKADPEFCDVRVGPLLVVAKALLLAARRHPGVNAAWDDDAQEIVVKHYVNLGIAAATPRGLVVPNVKDADAMSLLELAGAVADLTAAAREGRTSPADMQGGTITITNVGVFGIDAGTPIINQGESAILCFGAVRWMPWVVEGADGARTIEPRQVTQLALSFDHRLIDGDLGGRFLGDIARVLERPEQALVWA